MYTSLNEAVKYDRCIVFGATENIGSFTALAAHKRGAQVYLAMQDTSKPIPLLATADGSFKRIRADLADAGSCAEAVIQSGAKAAYIYHIPSIDGMRFTLTAMKHAGLEYVVFLSALNTLSPHDIQYINPEDTISFLHAQVEYNLEDLEFVGGFVAIRCGQLAANCGTTKLNKSTPARTAHESFPSAADNEISPADLGEVVGAVLTSPPYGAEAGKRIDVPEAKMLTCDEQWNTTKQSIGRNTNIINYEEDVAEFREFLILRGFPERIANDIVAQQDKTSYELPDWYQQWDGFYAELMGDVEEYDECFSKSLDEFVLKGEWL